jgi:hypothetical protein
VSGPREAWITPIGWIARWRERALARRAFEPRWRRWPATAVLAAAAVLYCCGQAQAMEWALVGFFVVMAAQFGLLLALRLRFSLLEMLCAAIVCASVNGLLLTMPGMSRSPSAALSLAIIVCAWVAYGLAIGMAQIHLFEATRPLTRLGLLAAAWFTTLAPTLVLGAALIWYCAPENKALLGAWRPLVLPFALVGGAGMILRAAIGWHARKRALAWMAGDQGKV